MLAIPENEGHVQLQTSHMVEPTQCDNRSTRIFLLKVVTAPFK